MLYLFIFLAQVSRILVAMLGLFLLSLPRGAGLLPLHIQEPSSKTMVEMIGFEPMTLGFSVQRYYQTELHLILAEGAGVEPTP